MLPPATAANPWEKGLHPPQWQLRMEKATQAGISVKLSQCLKPSWPQVELLNFPGLGWPHCKIMRNKTTRKHSESKLNLVFAWQGTAASFRCEFICVVFSKLKWKGLDLGGTEVQQKGKILNSGPWLASRVDGNSLGSGLLSGALSPNPEFQRAWGHSLGWSKLSKVSL